MRVDDRLTLCCWSGTTALLCGWLALGACGNGSEGTVPDCEDQQPTFVLTVRAAQGPLPSDFHMTVRYGGSTTEHYVIGQQASPGESMMFCHELPGSEPDGAGLPTVSAVRCDLYTGQAVEVTLEAQDYPLLVQTLTMERDEQDCVITSEQELLLERGDAGS
jgi:hypothetical protein